MPKIQRVVSEKIAELKDKNVHRIVRTVDRSTFPTVIKNGKELISFACNDYLGFAHHPKVKEAAADATSRFGAGAGASRLVSGSCQLYAELEEILSEYHQKEAVCVFGSGYLTNLGVISSIAADGDLIVTDKLAHACMIDGARLSGAKFVRYKHNSTAHLANILKTERHKHKNCLIVTETIFSMDGDAAPLAELSHLSRHYDAWLMTDGAHNVIQKPEAAEIITGTLSKTFGSYGGYVAADTEVVEYIKASARSLIFSTALPPAALAASIAAVNLIKAAPEILTIPLKKASAFCTLMGMPTPESQIVPLITGGEQKALDTAAYLEENGFLVPAIRPPTVPPGSSGLRFSFSLAHSDSDIERLTDAIKRCTV